VEEALRAAPAARRLTAPLWGREEHVRELLGDRVTDVSAERRILTVYHFGRPEDFRDYVKARHGPTIAMYRSLAGQPERVAALDGELAELARRFDRGQGSTVLDWDYLLLTATKRRERIPGPR
jgi:hypothetical protein